jgi:arginine/lysine/ornithine decarboxylase
MASMNASRYIMETRGEGLISVLLENISWFRNKIASEAEYRLLGAEHIGVNNIYDIDKTKIEIKSRAGGKKLDSILRSSGIQVEMSDIYNVVLICSVGDIRESFEKLYNVLINCKAEISSVPEIEIIGDNMPEYKSAVNMREAYYKPQKRVKLSEAEGLISCELAAPYPPGIPVLLPGEIITKDVIESLEFYKSKEIQINGLTDINAEYIKVISI